MQCQVQVAAGVVSMWSRPCARSPLGADVPSMALWGHVQLARSQMDTRLWKCGLGDTPGLQHGPWGPCVLDSGPRTASPATSLPSAGGAGVSITLGLSPCSFLGGSSRLCVPGACPLGRLCRGAGAVAFHCFWAPTAHRPGGPLHLLQGLAPCGREAAPLAGGKMGLAGLPGVTVITGDCARPLRFLPVVAADLRLSSEEREGKFRAQVQSRAIIAAGEQLERRPKGTPHTACWTPSEAGRTRS